MNINSARIGAARSIVSPRCCANLARSGPVVAVFVILSGCTQQSGSVTPPVSGPPPRTDLVTSAVFSSPDFNNDNAAIVDAENKLIAPCMTRHGFTFTYAPTAPEPIFVQVPDPSKSKKIGYGISTSTQTSNQDPNVAHLSTLERSSYLKAFLGTDETRGTIKLRNGTEGIFSTEGCLADARKKIYTDLRIQIRIEQELQGIRNTLYQKALKDPSYLELTESWQSCMKKRGYAYPSPQSAAASIGRALTKSGPTAGLQKKEKQLATEDAICDQKTGLTRTLLARVGEGISKLPTADLSLLKELTFSRQAAVLRAHEIIADR